MTRSKNSMKGRKLASPSKTCYGYKTCPLCFPRQSKKSLKRDSLKFGLLKRNKGKS